MSASTRPAALMPCRLCKTCPFCPGSERLGWMPGSRQAILEGLEHPYWFMECHDKERVACAGFVMVLGPESIGVRLAIIRGRLRPMKPLRGMARSFKELDHRAAGATGWD